jgi:hypothetical protein
MSAMLTARRRLRARAPHGVARASFGLARASLGVALATLAALTPQCAGAAQPRAGAPAPPSPPQARVQTPPESAAAPSATASYVLKRLPDMPDGAPAFVILGPDGQPLQRIECLQNGWVRADELAAQLLSSTAVMAAIIARRGQVGIEDLGPAMHNCVPAAPPQR